MKGRGKQEAEVAENPCWEAGELGGWQRETKEHCGHGATSGGSAWGAEAEASREMEVELPLVYSWMTAVKIKLGMSFFTPHRPQCPVVIIHS